MSVSQTELKSKVYRAGAGAGKTYTLVHEVLCLAKEFHKENGTYPRLVVTTFTRKATEELRERLMQKVLEWQDWDLLKFVTSHSQLHISTIHGVLSMYLVRHGHSFGVDPSFQIMSEGETRSLARQILRRLLIAEEAFDPLLSEFSVNELVEVLLEYSAAKQQWPHLRVSSLKDFSEVQTRALRDLGARLEIVALSLGQDCAAWADSWKKVALEIQAVAVTCREGGLDQGGLAQLWQGLKLPQNKARKGEYPLSKELADEWDSMKKEVKAFIDNPIFNEKLWPRFCQGYEQMIRLAEPFHQEFCSLKIQSGQISMRDLELLSLESMRNFPDTAIAFSQSWDYWFIDEFQDTSPLQVELFKSMVGDRRQFIVGDPQQSIYLFRGADVGVFEQAEKHIEVTGGEHKELIKNYRSEPELLLFMNDFFARLSTPFRGMEPTGLKTGESPKIDKIVAHFAVAPVLDRDLKASSVAEGGAQFLDKVDLNSGTSSVNGVIEIGSTTSDLDQVTELAAISQHIYKLLKQGAKFEDCCVLARTRRQLQEVADDLSQRGFPTRVHSSSGFWQRREIKDCVALLRFLLNPMDNRNLLEVLRSPWFFVEDEFLVRVIHGAHERDVVFWDLFTQAHVESSQEFEAIGELNRMLQDSMTIGISATLQKAVAHGGLMDWSHRHDSTGQRESNLWKFISRLREEEKRPGFNYFEFLKGATPLTSVDSMGSEDAEAVAALEPNRIQLMTVHGAKGLQFDHVLIPFCNRSANLSSTRDYPFVANGESWAMSWAVLDDDDKKLASPLAWEFACQQKKREQDENLRLLYVAITRAKKSLFMSWTGEAARDSWLNAMNWPTDSVGIHQGKNYRYAVSHGPWPGGIWKQTLSFEEQVVRPAYSASPPNFNKVNCYQEGVELNTINQETGRTSVTHRLAETADSAISQTENTEKLLAILTTAQRGTMVHRLFELIKYSAPATLNEYVSQWFNEGQDEVRSALSFVLKCQSPPLLDIIQSGYVEWGFVYFDQDLGTTLEGQIDLWGEVNDQVWLVDYKTGHSRYRDKALAQLQIYARALVALGYARSISDIRCVAVYPFESTKVEVRF